MRISAKADYAVRAAVELAAAQPEGRPVTAQALAEAQGIPKHFLENILADLRTSGIVRTKRGPDGGYLLAQDASAISLADVLRAVEGPLAAIQGVRPDQLHYGGAATRLPDVWVALRANLRAVLERVNLADLARGKLPRNVERLLEDPDARTVH